MNYILVILFEPHNNEGVAGGQNDVSNGRGHGRIALLVRE